jgi:hypothetical protein
VLLSQRGYADPITTPLPSFLGIQERLVISLPEKSGSMTRRSHQKGFPLMSNQEGCQCGQAHGACATEFQYAVKVVCGTVAAQPGVPTPVAPGSYWTAINIHSPEICQDAHFRWKVAIANPLKAGPVSAFQRSITLHPDEACEVDCAQVMQVFSQQPPLSFIKGYAVIQSDKKLDVVAVYSGTPGACGSNTFFIERVEPRCIPICDDLFLSLNTGVAAWTTISPTTGPVALVTPPSGGWVAPPFGSSWVSEKSTDGQAGTPISRSYQLCFDLCSGFTAPQPFQIQAMADGSGSLYLNNTLVGPVGNWLQPTTLLVNPNLLHPGNNCFRMDVVNGGTINNPTGFALAGSLYVVKGKCPCTPLPMNPAAPHGPAGFDSSSG